MPEPETGTRSRRRLQDVLFLAAVAVCALVFLGQVVRQTRAPGEGEGAAARAVKGETRLVDEGRLRRLLRQGHLSDREAMHYAPLTPVTEDAKAGP